MPPETHGGPRWEDSQPDRYPCGCDGTAHWHPRAEIRVTAYWYAAQHGLPCDLASLLELGLRAARQARWLGIGEQKTLEGPAGNQIWVHTWPARVFDEVIRDRPAQAGILEIYRKLSPGHGITQEEARMLAGAYGPDEVIPQYENHDAGWGEGVAPWDGDDVR